MGVVVKSARSAARMKIKAGVAAMIPAVAEQALADCNEYVRVYQGQLKESSETASVLQRGELVWNTPYARRVYYTGTPSTDVNTNASLRWCDKAHDLHREEWQEIAQKNFEKGMRNK